MLRGEWFAALSIVVLVLVVFRVALRRPLFWRRARPLTYADAAIAAVSLALLAFHCAAMFAPDVVAALRVLDGPASVVRDLRDPVGRAAYWLPAAALVAAVRHLWWPAPVGSALTLFAVGWTMYGGFTLTEHLVAIVTGVTTIALVATGLVTRPTGAVGGVAQPSP